MNPTPQGQGAQAPPQMRFLRPEQMRTINYLTADEKQKYEDGLRQLYQKMEQNGPDTQEHQVAKQKVAEFSRMVVNKIKNIQARGHAASQGQPSQAGQAGHPGHPGLAGHPNPQQQPIAQADPAQNSMAAAQKFVNRPQVPAQNANAGNTGPSNPNVAPASNQLPTAVPKPIMEHMSRLPWGSMRTPSQLPPEQATKWLNEMRQRYARSLMQMESIKARNQKIDAMIKERQEKGQLSAEDQKKFQDQKNADAKQYSEAQRFVESVRQQLKIGQAGAQGSGAQQARPQSMQTQNASAPASSHPMQAATASVNAAMDAAKSQQLAATRPTVPTSQPQAQPQPQQPQQQQQQHPGTPATPATPSAGVQQHPQQVQAQSHPAPTPQPQIKTEPANNIPHPPPVNTALAAAAASSTQMSSAGTPTQGAARVQTPQSAGQQAGSQVRPLTHAAAVNRANSSTNISNQPNSASGAINSTSGSTGLLNTSNQAGHSHAHPQPNTPALNPKMPINKTLPKAATETPAPVPGPSGSARPTMPGGGAVGGGVMAQPVIQKMPVLQFDADGEHVLSSKKLNELVRQVCGGGSPGADGNYLTPDVEESVLNVADNFIDSVLHSACRLAKERGSKVLEIRDIQLVLERVYNIRIPGYTSDELRTVRKVQPSPNWISKVHAVQAAKVMPGKDDK
ncbi:hypothetical protein F5Y05DRAFT_391453 [Hypoxylon sp. FL0543]|nr:hypothetical protein F5Y05DRAFT_391453 [Hypoxylon sp. FL0543]